MSEIEEAISVERDVSQTNSKKSVWKKLFRIAKFIHPFVTFFGLLVSTAGLFVAIYAINLTQAAREQNSISNQENLKHLKSLDSLFADANLQLKLLPTSLTEFRSSVEGMSEIVTEER